MADMFRVLAVTAVIVLAGSCSGPCGGSPPAGAPKQHLVFTGPPPGTLTTADVVCHLFNDQSPFNTLIIGPDAKSGVVDANLGDGEHVTGSFTCSELKTD